MVDLQKLKADFEEAYKDLKLASVQYAKASLALDRAKRKYEEQKGEALLDENIKGKNAEIREAEARRLLTGTVIKLAECEDAFSNAKAAFAMASTRKDELEAYLEIAKLEKV